VSNFKHYVTGDFPIQAYSPAIYWKRFLPSPEVNAYGGWIYRPTDLFFRTPTAQCLRINRIRR